MSQSIHSIILGSELDNIDIKCLLGVVTGFSRSEIITNNNYKLSSLELELLSNLIRRRITGEPLSYILGYKEFYSRNFKVTPDTLIPRPETELLIDKILELAKLREFSNSSKQCRVLDLGTGSGCIAITCKLEDPLLEVVASDKYKNTLDVAKQNANTLKANIQFVCSDWFSDISGIFDIIVSNPPYIALNDTHLSDLRYEPRTALTDESNDGLDFIRTIIVDGYRYLKPGGYLLLEHGYTQAVQSRRLMQDAGFVGIETLKDYAGLDRITVGYIAF